MGSIEVASSPALPGYKATDFKQWRKALARVRVNAGDAKILCIGDSTTAGVGVNNSQNQGAAYCYPYQLAAILNGLGITAAKGLGVPGPNSSNNDTRWAPGSGWINGNFGWGASSDWELISTATPSSIVYSDTVMADSFDVYYLKAAGLGSMTITATGGTGTVVNSNGAAGIGKITVTAASAATNNTLTILPSASSGDVHIIGVEPWLSTASKVRVGNAGVGSSQGVKWAAVSSPAGIGGADAIKAYAPDLAIISLGLNDANAGAAIATFDSALATLIAACQASGDVLLMLPIPSQSTAGSGFTANIQSFYGCYLSKSNPIVDLRRRWVTGDAGAQLGFYYDSLHPNERGYADIAQTIATILKNI